MSPQTQQFNPDAWLTSLTRALKEYVMDGLGLSGAASDPYEVRMSYPDVTEVADKLPLKKTMIHFEIDDPRQVMFGLGDNVVHSDVDESNFVITEWEAHCHDVDIDVGVWASVESGGSTSRMEAREDLDKLFNGPSARETCMTETNGVDPREFSGGRFLTDTISDVLVFRIVDMTLRVRVYSRTVIGPTTYADTVVQAPDLTIYGQSIT